MSNKGVSSLIKGLFQTSFIQVSNRLLLLAIGIVIARSLPAEQFGQYSFLLSIIVFTLLPAISGLNTYLVRNLSVCFQSNNRDAISKLVSWSLWHVVIICFCCSIGLIFFVSRYDSVESTLIFYLPLLVLFRALVIEKGSIAQVVISPVFSTLCQQVMLPLLVLIFLTCLIFTDTITIDNILLIQVISTFVVLCFCSVFVRRALSGAADVTSVKLSQKEWRHYISTWFPFFVIAAIQTANMEVATFYVGYLGMYEELGRFKVAMQGAGVILIATQALSIMLAPKLAAFYERDKDMLQGLISSSVRWSVILVIPIVAVFSYASEPLITLIFGSQYAKATTPFIIVCCGYFSLLLFGPGALVLTMTGHLKQSLMISAFTLCVNLLILSIFVPSLQEVGASYAVAISFILQGLVSAFIVFRLTGLKVWLRVSKRSAL